MSAEPTWAPVQGAPRKAWALMPSWFYARFLDHRRWIPEGKIPWADHLRVYEVYTAKFGPVQSAERIAERGGFGVEEIALTLGMPDVLERWEPRS